jgi:hypothetical protein
MSTIWAVVRANAKLGEEFTDHGSVDDWRGYDVVEFDVHVAEPTAKIAEPTAKIASAWTSGRTDPSVPAPRKPPT